VSEVKFVRIKGRIVPIRKKDNGANKAQVASGAAIATYGATSKGFNAKTFSAKVFRGPGISLVSVSDKKRFLPRAFAITRKNSVGGEHVMYASNLFTKSNKGWGKKLFATVQANAISKKRKNISGTVISNEALRFMKKENSKFFAHGREINYASAKKVIKRGAFVKGMTQINPKNRSFVALGIKGAYKPNPLIISSGLLLAGIGMASKGRDK
jgi:hypothetical protein